MTNTSPRYLTKTRFKLAIECPTKLYYTGKPSIYPDTKLDDEFLRALADGGYQVGELAKHYFPGGHEVTSTRHDEAVAQTTTLLAQDNVVIFEAAVRHENLFVRVDVLVKRGTSIELFEVKAKSYSANKDRDLLNGAGNRVASAWRPYVYDIAFQRRVVSLAFPEQQVTCFLMLVNKDAVATTDGLNQKFMVTRDANDKRQVRIAATLQPEDVAQSLLISINTEGAVQLVYETELQTGFPEATFKDNISTLAALYAADTRINPVIGKRCKACEFRCSNEEEVQGFRSGFKECWREQLRWQDADFLEPTVLDIWNFRRADQLINNGIVKMRDATAEDIGVEDCPATALGTSERQWLQVDKVRNQDTSVYFDADSLRREMQGWTYPLHFIDFETSTVAIPFYKGMRPYEGIAFQFSHHVEDEHGRVEHAGEYLNTRRGELPNFDFVRELKRQLEQDEGTVFRYSNHENTYLITIYKQLQSSSESDRDALCAFIQSITKSTGNGGQSWCGERCMVDLLELVKAYYYDPATNGSNSIKHVLPAVLNSSRFLQDTYSQPVYGSNKLPSLNFQKQVWVTRDAQGRIIDPYQLLPRMFQDASAHDEVLLSLGDELNSGGLALTAYARLQFEEMSEYERDEIGRALLKYCELDTLAMVMIYQAWRSWVDHGLDTL